jgi:hypothetical protein
MDRAKEFKRILDMWSQRDLSLIGKITILKSLAFSKIIYQCGMMTTTTQFCDFITDIAYNFIWNNKPDKIKRQTIIADYEKGGLKMLDVSSFFKAQKAMWVKRFLSKERASWKAAPTLYLETFLGENTFKCNTACKEKPKNFPHFYWQMMQSWFEIKRISNNEMKSPFEIRRECLWLNKEITPFKKEIKWEEWHSKGINIIHDIVNEDGSFLNATEIEAKFNFKCNIMEYNALKEAIPVDWRKTLKTMRVPSESISFDEDTYIRIGNKEQNVKKLTNKSLYWSMIGEKQIKPIFMVKLQQELHIEEDEWETILTIPSVVLNTKIRAFQYKLLFNLLPCNLYLFRITKSDTDRCRVCNKLDDSAHFLFECPSVVPFWNSFMNWWNAMTNTEVYLDKRSAITGFMGQIEDIQTINACLLFAKWHVYKCKLNESEVFFYKFMCELKYILDIEKIIAIKKDKLHKYNDKWQMVENYIT